MTALFRLRGDNQIVQIDQAHRNLAFIRKVTATRVNLRIPSADPGHYEYSDTTASRGNRLYAIRTGTDQYIRFIRNSFFYGYPSPSGTVDQLWFDNPTGAAITVYVFDWPQTVAPSGPLLRLIQDSGQVAYDSRERYMDVKAMFTGQLVNHDQEASVSLPSGTYAVAPLAEANKWDVFSCTAGWCDYNDSVSWWRTSGVAAGCKMVKFITEAPQGTVIANNPRFQSLVINVAGL